MPKQPTKSGLQLAIEAAERELLSRGDRTIGQAALAKVLGLTRGAVNQWTAIPAKHHAAIAALGVPRKSLAA